MKEKKDLGEVFGKGGGNGMGKAGSLKKMVLSERMKADEGMNMKGGSCRCKYHLEESKSYGNDQIKISIC